MPSATAVATPEPTAALPYRFEILPLDEMFTAQYQRPLTSFVKEIETDFDPALVGTIAVSERSVGPRSKKRYAVMDGQTRAEGMRRRGMTAAPCIVYHGLTSAQEADLFAKFQLKRRGMHSAERFNAEVHAQHTDQVAILRTVEELGFSIGKNNGGGQIAAVAALEYAYFGASAAKKKRTPNRDLLVATLTVIREAWPKLPDIATTAVTIKGMARFLADNPSADRNRLVAALGKVTPDLLAKRAQALREGRGMTGSSPKFFAEAVEAAYRSRPTVAR